MLKKEKDDMERNTINIPTKLHAELKVRSAQLRRTLLDCLIEAINDFLTKTKGITLCLVLLGLVGCSTPQYHETKVPVFTYEEIDHQQKIRTGQTKAEVMTRFGRPDRVYMVAMPNARSHIVLSYWFKIWCDNGYEARVYVDPQTNVVVRYDNFRYEFTEDLRD